MRIIISGAGIGGLTLAAAMHGESITVVEKRTEATGIGAGLLLHDEALAALRSAGIEVRGRRFNQVNLGFADGRRLPPIKKSGLAIKRPDLHCALLSRCAGIDIRCSATIDWFQEDDSGVDVCLSDGSELRADVLIGADGLGSGIRKLHGSSVTRRYSGTTCWRGLSEIDCPTGEPLEIWGRGLRVGMIPLNSGSYLFLTESAPPNQPRTPPPFEKFSHFCHGAPELIATVPSHTWAHHDLEELAKHFWGTPRVPLLGDAAHAFTPNLGEGAAQAILDANRLAKKLRSGDCYPGARRGKNARIAVLSRWVGRIGQARGRLGAVRDILLRPFSR